MVESDSSLTLFIISPKWFWTRMKVNNKHLPLVLTHMDSRSSEFGVTLEGIERLENQSWSKPNPSFIRSNFGLYADGVVLGVEYSGKVIGSLYCLCPTMYKNNVHIWNLIVHPEHRRRGIGKLLFLTVLTSLAGIADTISLQARTDSDSISLYTKFGQCTIIYAHTYDTNGDWKKPKIGLEMKVPSLSNKAKNVVNNCGEPIYANSQFWKKLGQAHELWGKISLVGASLPLGSNIRILNVIGSTREAKEFITTYK